MQHQTGSVTRFACLMAVLLVSSAWQCLANEYADAATEAPKEFKSAKRTKIAKLRSPTYNADDLAETIRLAEAAQKLVVLAESANKLAADAANKVSALHARAKTAVNATKKTAAEVNAIAKEKPTFGAAQKAAQDAQMAAEIANDLYGNETANPTLIEEHGGWFKERIDGAKKLEPTLNAAIKTLEESSKDGGMAQLVGDVLSPARSIFKFAQDAANDAKYMAQKSLYAELLAERVEIMQDIAQRAKQRAESSGADTAESCTSKNPSTHAAKDLHYRQAAARAYLHAVAAQKFAAKCVLRIDTNATSVDEMYHVLKRMLVKAKEADYNTTRLHHIIADEAHTSADESKRVAASTPENAAMYMKEAKSAVNSITPCASEKEAKWYAGMARRASQKALNEMHLAMYQLFTVTLARQQMTDAKSAVEQNSNNTETDNAITNPKERAIDSEEEAEKLYIAVKADADEAADKSHRVEDVEKRIRRLAAHHGSKSAAPVIEEQLEMVMAAARAARASSKQAQKAASSVYADYEDTKTAADSALRSFVQASVEKLEKAAAKAANAARESHAINRARAKEALDKVLQQEKRALEAYEEALHVVTEVHKTTQHATTRER